MGSIDLTDAYYSVPIDESYQKYLKFSHDGKLYKFTCMPNGLSSAPRYFTKLLKPILAVLRQQGFTSSSYLDDVLVLGESYKQCKMNIQTTQKLFHSLGFTINTKKSVTEPTQIIEHLGFIIYSNNMTVSLTTEKLQNVYNWCNYIIQSKSCQINRVAKVVGILISCLPDVQHGRLFC